MGKILGVLVALMLTNIASAQAVSNIQQSRYAGENVLAGLELDDGSIAGISLLQTDSGIDVRGLTAEVVIEQRFTYQGHISRDARYVFPLPDNAAVHALTIQIGDRTIHGVVKERGEARRVYDTAKAQGQKAALLQQQRPNLFSVDIASLQYGDTVGIELRYVQAVTFTEGTFSLRYPVNYVQRYTPAHNSASVLPSSTIAKDSHSISGRVDLALPLAAIDSRYHEISLNRQGLAYDFVVEQQDFFSAHDFVLEWQIDSRDGIHAAAFSEADANAQYLHVLIAAPTIEAQPTIVRKEQSFLIDVSGSMEGPALKQAKAGLLHALTRLKSTDTFNILAFNNSVRTLFERAQLASELNLQLARSFINGLEAAGGTDMLPALKQVFAQAEANDKRLAQVLFLTDGAVSNEAELLAYISSHAKQRRLFTVGIGAAPNSYFMRKAAQLGRGSFVYVANTKELAASMNILLKRLERPALTNITIDWPASAEIEAYPSVIPDLYAGESLLITARVKSDAALPSILKLSGVHGRQPWQGKVNISFVKAQSQPGALANVWARLKIESLMDSMLSGTSLPKAARQQIISTGVTYKIASQFTSFVAVDDSIENGATENSSRKRDFNLAQTGNGATQSIWWALLLLLFVYVLHHATKQENENAGL